MIERYSHSRLKTFEKCPAQFKIRYIDKVEKLDESIEAFVGKRVHEAIEFLYNEVQKRKFPILDTVLDQYKSLWKDAWHDRVGIVRRNEYEIGDYFSLGETCLARFYRKYKPFDEPVVGTEVELIFKLDNSDNYVIKGVLDRVDHDGNGNWEIHDYKSGKRVLSQYQADRDEQLGLYHIGLLKNEDNVKSVVLVWHFLQPGTEIRSFRTKKQLEMLLLKIKGNIDQIRIRIASGGEFPAKESILCNWCYYWEECPAKKRSNPFIY